MIRSKYPLLIVLLILIGFVTNTMMAVNLTPSMPRGVYYLSAFDRQKVQRGSIVSVCIPNRSELKIYQERQYLGHSTRCPIGMPPEIKPIGALPGDLVQIDGAGVHINGQLIANSKVFDTDSQGRPMAHLPRGWSHRLAAGEYFTLATHLPRSLDSRYYGPVTARDLLQEAHPVFTAAIWGGI